MKNYLLAIISILISSSIFSQKNYLVVPFDVKAGYTINKGVVLGAEISLQRIKPKWYFSLSADATNLKRVAGLVGPRLYIPITNGKINIHPYIGYKRFMQGNENVLAENFYFMEIGNKFQFKINSRAKLFTEINKSFQQENKTRIFIGLQTFL